MIWVSVPRFIAWRTDDDLSGYINSLAEQYGGGDPAAEEDIRKTAWMYLSLVEGHLSTEKLKEIAHFAVTNDVGFEEFFNPVRIRC